MRRVKNKVPSDKNKTLGREREMYKEQKQLLLDTKRKKKHECNVTFGSTVVN